MWHSLNGVSETGRGLVVREELKPVSRSNGLGSKQLTVFKQVILLHDAYLSCIRSLSWSRRCGRNPDGNSRVLKPVRQCKHRQLRPIKEDFKYFYEIRWKLTARSR
jgi:hypothetical protein